MTSETTTVVDELRAASAGRVISAPDPEYDQARVVFRGDFDGHPAAIARVTNASDIANAVAIARTSGLPLSVRSGGHSSAGHSTNDAGVVIDLRDMKRFDFAADGLTVWAESGLSAAELSQAAWERGVAVGFGDTGSVGIGGITLGGGIGYLVREHGMTIDNLLAAEIVTADGDTLHVDEISHPDLFWAIRGGGGNFGVVTRFKYSLAPLPSFVGGMMVLPATPETIVAFMTTAAEADERLSTIANVMPCPPLPFVAQDIVGQIVIFALLGFSGASDDADAVLAPIRALKPIADLVKPMPYPEMYPPEDPSYRPKAADYTFFMDHVDGAAARTIIERLEASDAPLRAVQLRALGGAMARVPIDATAFAHRDAPILAVAVNFYEGDHDHEQRIGWTRDTVAALDQGVPGAYVGFVREEDDERLRQIYPDETWERLRDVKTRYDPDNVFRRNHNVPPRTTG